MMLTSYNKIILVDDNQEDLQRLSNVFHKNGLGCYSFKYDMLYGQPLTGIQIAFFDINLNSAQDGALNYASLQSALKQYIDKDNGPFALVFWTKAVEDVKGFIEYMNRDNIASTDIPYPYFISYINKLDFLSPETDLEAKVSMIISDPTLQTLWNFNDVIANSVRETMNQLLSLITNTANGWGRVDGFSKLYQQVFSKIAIETLGFEYAKKNPDHAIKTAMMPILEHQLMADTKPIFGELLKNLQTEKNPQIIQFPKTINKARLNTIFNIDTTKHAKNERGSVCLLKCTKDNCVSFKNHFDINYCDWFSITLPGLSREQRNESIPIAVEISAACDFAQNKKRTNKYLLGVILPENAFDNLDDSHVGDFAFYIKTPFEVFGNNKVFAFNLNFSFALCKDDDYLEEPAFQFKKEMMDMIGNRYANHISRIGITSFR